jgi:hypothetical protein
MPFIPSLSSYFRFCGQTHNYKHNKQEEKKQEWSVFQTAAVEDADIVEALQ